MKNFLIMIFSGLIVFSCNENKKQEIEIKPIPINMSREISSVIIKDLVVDSMLNVRAIEISNNGLEAISSRGIRYSVFTDKENDTLFALETIGRPNSRSSAFQNGIFHHLSIGSPAKLYKSGMLVYLEDHPKVFYDSMEFWNANEGIAIGDPTAGCMSIIITRDAGETFKKLDCSKLPKAMDGEAAFAASDTNIAIIGDNTWVATGGMASRILYSPDKGETWEIYETPIVQGKETTGIYSIDFYDEKNGFAIGGDYTDPDSDISNKIRTTDGGKNWEVVADSTGPGYRSCVQYVPNGESNELVAIGFKGIDYSNDQGNSWKHLSDEGFYTIRFVNDSIAFAAGKGRISKLIFQ